MTCAEARPLLDAYFDSELDLSGSLSVERHAAECPACAGELAKLSQLREKLTPDVWEIGNASELRAVENSVRKATRQPVSIGWRTPAMVAMAAALVIAVLVPMKLGQHPVGAEREMVDSHVRSLMAQHLVDVPSSDKHTVKPWFQGKVDFAPDVPDLTARGFELVGGRLDVMQGRQAVALVYRRRGHLINLSIARTSSGDAEPDYASLDGYQTAHWESGGLERWAISDINGAELREFVAAIRGR